jgi:hypothetical protein
MRLRVAGLCVFTALAAVVAFKCADWSIYGTDQFRTVTTTSSTTTTQPVITVRPLPPEPAPATVTTKVRKVTTTTTPAGLLCPELWSTLQAFWPEELVWQADYVVWAETRCQNLHRSDVGRIGYGDHGYFQINAINLGYLASWGITADDLMNPAQNVVAARILYQWADKQYGCGWQPWYSSVNPWQLCNG